MYINFLDAEALRLKRGFHTWRDSSTGLEHFLYKGEVPSSILGRATIIKPIINKCRLYYL